MEENHNPAPSIDSDEDYEIYFLQPASSPYNIKEKVEEANQALLEDNPTLESRILKVQFKENLIDFEPELTDDDVQSIESYNEVIDLSVIHQESFENSSPRASNKLELSIFTQSLQVINEAENVETQEEIICEENEVNEEDFNVEDNIEEDTETQASEIDKEEEEIEELDDVVYENCSGDIVYEEESVEEIEYSKGKEMASEEISSSKHSTPESSNNSPTRNKKDFLIDCKSHCIEKLEFDVSINRLKISEKPVCPTLKLIKRKCCQQKHTNSDRRLPCYSGLRSEYGMSLTQLEKRQRRKELAKLKEDKRKKIMEEYAQRKVQQNEEIFCQWLKNIERRKDETKRKKRSVPTILNVSAKFTHKAIRPKTSLPCRSAKRTKRPQTSPACVLIEVPDAILKRGINIGEFLVAKSSNKNSAKTLHLLSLS